jgi:twitching motility protein PilT
MTIDLDALLRESLRLGASDLHLKAGAPPHLRVAGELTPLDGHAPLDRADTVALAEEVLRSEGRRRDLDERGAADASYPTTFGRFRVAAFRQRDTTALVFRAIAEAPDAAELGLPETVCGWAGEARGLIVVTGPTGAGKSSTCAALLRRIGERRRCHIVTIEDPIEFIHPDRLAIVSQREVGLDAPSAHDALRSSLRHDPDVILIGEVRDEESAIAALRAAETGHLVLCTMHTIDAVETIQRFVALCGSMRPELTRQLLGATLVGVVSQRLVPALAGGRALAAEVLVSSTRVRDVIAHDGGARALHQAIAEGDYYGMRTFDQALVALAREGVIDREQAVANASSPHDLELMLSGARDGVRDGVRPERA